MSWRKCPTLETNPKIWNNMYWHFASTVLYITIQSVHCTVLYPYTVHILCKKWTWELVRWLCHCSYHIIFLFYKLTKLFEKTSQLKMDRPGVIVQCIHYKVSCTLKMDRPGVIVQCTLYSLHVHFLFDHYYLCVNYNCYCNNHYYYLYQFLNLSLLMTNLV